MDFRILGPLEVFSDHGVVTLGGRKPRAVLAVLLLHANESVSPERLARALWGEDAPAGTVKTVQVHVSRLRKALGDGGLVTTTPAGYQLRVLPGELDAQQFEQLVQEGRGALEDGRAEDAAAVLREAASLWRGPPLADLAFEPFAQTEIARLEEQRLEALELRVEADAAAGRHAELVSELRRLVAEHPTRERLAGQLMIALYRCGRQSEALDAYREARGKLAEEIGVEPGPELRAIHAAVLRHDPALDLAQVEELPHEVEAAAAAPLAGRDAELEWLRDRWEEARAGRSRLVVLAGDPGMGKTRLAAELAVEVLRHGGAVRYASGVGPAQTALETLAAARSVTRRLLLVLDDADRAGAEVLAAVRELPNTEILILATATDPEALAGLETSGVLFLKPLGSQGIGAIAALYAPDRAAENVPVEWLLGATSGVPRRVHDVASRWARDEAAKRVSAVAGRAAAGRAELRFMEAELAGGVAQLQTARDWGEPAEEDGERVVCPFKGLASFEAADAPYFFGRERLVAELVARLVGAPLLAVVGPSGSGKSSVVRAGLLPALAGGVLPGSDDWPQVLIRPGEHPAHELRRAIDGVVAERYVLAVDQFEETFTVCRDEAERERFVADLVRASRPEAGAVVVIALRADFYGRCAAHPALSRLLAANHVLVGAMRQSELQRAIVGPAQRVGLHVEPELVDALVKDTENEPGALPLLSTALLELWRRRDGRRLRYAAYKESGGVHKAVARLAEDGYARLEESQKPLARTALLRLAEVEPEGGVERRRLPLDEFDADVIGRLADARLLTVSAGTVEFTHEALLREWPRLRQWIEDDREDLKVHRSLSAAEREWMRLGRDEGVLFRGAQLEEAREWAERGDPGPTEAESAFLDASLECEHREQRRHRRNLTIAFGALALGLVIVAAIAAVAVNGRRDAEDQRNIASSRALALQSANTLDADPSLALTLALRAVDSSPTEQAVAALRDATVAVREVAALPVDSLTARTAALSADGSLVVGGGDDGIVGVWDALTRRRLAEWRAGHGALLTARYAPGGQQLALGFEDGTLAVAEGSLETPRTVLRVSGAPVESVAYSGDGRRIAAGLGDGSVRVIAAGGGSEVRLSGHEGPVLGLGMDEEGARVVSAGADGSVRLWSVEDGAEERALHAGEPEQADAEFSPDGRTIVSVGFDGWIRLWDTSTGTQEGRIRGSGRELEAAAFSPDGSRFAAAGHEGVVRVWSTAGGPPVAELRGQGSRVYDVGFGATADRVVSAGEDGSARIWDAGRTQVWQAPQDTSNINFSPDGRSLSGGSGDGSARVWEAAGGREVATLPGPAGYTTARYSPTSNEVVVANDAEASVSVWPVAGKVEAIDTVPEGDLMNAARFGHDGEQVVYVDGKSRIVVHDLTSGDDIALAGAPKDIWDVQLSPDGSRVAAGGETGDVLIWRLDRPNEPDVVAEGHTGHLNAVAYGPGGRIASAGSDRTIRIWDERGTELALLQGHDDEISTVLFTNDGGRILSSSQDGTVRLWDVDGGDALAVIQSGSSELHDVTLSRDGSIATLDDESVVRVFRCEVCGSLEAVRALARTRVTRPLTPEERERFLTTEG